MQSLSDHVEKQAIAEMYKDVYEAISHNSVIDLIHGGFIGINTDGLTRELYDDGYRKQEWISVDERLPKQWEMVLVFCDDIISTDFISSTGRWYEHIDHDSVTHWMPLPEPPKMKGE